MIRRVWIVGTALAILVGLLSGTAQAGQAQGSIAGAVFDSLGARVAGASVTLLRDGQQAATTAASADGSYRFPNIASGRYQLRAAAVGFQPTTSEPLFLGAGSSPTVDLTLQIGALQQGVVVTASAAAIPQSQSGAPVTVIGEDVLSAINKPDLLEALRLVPGAQVHQTAGRGGTTSLFIRGGNSNFAKVLIDGVPANDIGGGFDFSQMATTGISRVEVLRQSNSVVYGADALAGVVNVETKRGRTRVPEIGLSIDGGNLGTFRNAVSLGGAIKRFDYFSEYSFLTTDNNVPNNGYTNKTYAGRFGVTLGRGTDLSGIIRRVDGAYESPNAFSLFQIADDSSQQVRMTYAGVTAQSQWSDRFQTTVRVGNADQTSEFLNPAPSGEAFDPFGFGANYLGKQVTIAGANGFSTTGRAILDFGGQYPQPFRTRTARRVLQGQATYTVVRDFALSAGGRVERELGYSDPGGDATTTRDNGGLFVEARGSLGARTYATGGLGYEQSASFESVVMPRVSIATYLRRPALGPIGDSKVSFNAGRGIKAPAVFQVDSSLFALLQNVPGAPAVSQIAPEQGTSIDVGLEQGFWDGQARLRVAWFRNSYDDLIEFVGKTVLPQLGVPQSVAQATPFGAYVNSQSYDASGLELSGEALVTGHLRLMASYTFLDAVVTESFGSGALSPAINPAFPGVRIGAFSPLVGERPFRRPAHSGTLMVSYTAGPGQVTLSSYFSGARDDSTFLSDAFFGNSMLLPNQGLSAAYQKFDLSGSYQLHRRVKPYVSIENLFDEQYEAAFGYPSLPRTARVGLTLRLGGD